MYIYYVPSFRLVGLVNIKSSPYAFENVVGFGVAILFWLWRQG